MEARDIDSGNILLEDNLCKNIFVTFHTKLLWVQNLRICFNKIDGFIQIYDRIRHLVILGQSWFDEICDSIKYQKSGSTDSIN